ncbi:GumC family protein [Lutimonas zeaxanthinifaciens]|uniref:GumC family protein n=1 Tax=Lutimonas zeaxanthinifaciens TaxID=3060215 RepID=UPI00265D20A8|nr:tyrosine-protein kinase [Lutimonas sp. YSD2104]WKK66472.1 polysaccharide biosynthesis tyrosine autokinase [Lutimonas sp. YSD2104]
MQKENPLNYLFVEDEPVNYRASIEKYLFQWKWFVLGVIMALLAAYVYLRYTPNQYEVNAAILIDDEDKGGGIASELEAFKDLGLMGDAKTSIDTEIDVLKSRTLIQRTVKDLGINVTYHTIAKIRARQYYKNSSPVIVNFLKKDSSFFNLDTSFTILPKGKTEFLVQSEDEELIIEGFYGEKIEDLFGGVIVTPTDPLNVELDEGAVIKISPFKEVANHYLEKISIETKSKKSSVLVLSLKDEVKLKAEDILNNLVLQYNQDAIEDKQLIAKNTNDFINSRISDISVELADVDLGVETYKTDNKLTDIEYEAGLVLESNSELEKQIVDLTAQIKLIDYVQNYMTNNKEDLIPSNLGLKDETTSQSTLNYNQLLLERNRILTGSSRMNPTVINLEAQIDNLRKSIEQSLVNLRRSLALSLNEARIQENKLNSKRALAPKQEREFQDIKRKQLIVETLYLYLLEKREENAITLAVTAPNAKLLDVADGSSKPVEPRKKIVFLIAIVLGLAIPFVILYIRSLLDNKIHTVEEVEKEVEAPVLGDIPTTGSEKKMIITEKDNSNVAESFRLLRTNVGFMLPQNKEGGKSIFVTSTIGNEGKTFVSLNLANALTLINKRVLLIGADIRKPKISQYLNIEPKVGLTNYLIDHHLEVADVLTDSRQSNLDVIASGPIPPNPSELLTNGRFDEVLAYGRKHYDFVIVDTAPVNIVTDTLLLANLADLFIYVVRANYLDKRLLSVPKKMFENKRLPNMAILINDTNYEKKGYGYGYSYGYGYTETKKSWWKKAG